MDEELGDEQWELIALLLLKHRRRGRPWADEQRTIKRHSLGLALRSHMA